MNDERLKLMALIKKTLGKPEDQTKKPEEKKKKFKKNCKIEIGRAHV
jgi:hypothetical protein